MKKEHPSRNSIQTFSGRNHFASAQWPIFMQRCVRDGDVVSHNHDYMEIVFIASGEGIHHSLHGSQKVRAGDVFVLRPGAWHAYHDCKKMEVFNCCFGIQLLNRELNSLAQDPAIGYLFYAGPLSRDRKGILSLRLEAPAIKECRSYLQPMLRSFQDAEPSGRIRWMGYFLLLLGHLMQGLKAQYYSSASPQNQWPTRLHESVRETIRLFEERPAYDWTLPELSRRVHLNASYLVRLFKAGTGLAPLSYLARLRAENAASLLLRTEHGIADIGLRVGWSDPSYFAQRFKTHFGLSPREYRARFTPLPTSEK